MKKWIPTALCLLVVAAVIGAGGDRNTNAASPAPASDRGSLDASPQEPWELEFDGLIRAHRVVHLGAAIDGLLEQVHVERGDVVREGEVLATLESRLQQATLELARGRASMEAEKRSRAEQLRYQSSKLARAEQLHTQGVLSHNELAVSRTERAVAQEAVLESEERQEVAALEVKRAEVALALRTVLSPIDGVVVERHLSPGELVTRQHQSKILVLAEVDPLIVEVILPASLFGKVPQGTEAKITPTGVSHTAAIAVVTRVDRVIDAASNTFQVALELPNADHGLPPGLQCQVVFTQDDQ